MIGWGDLRREPYRLLFPLGIAFSCLGVGHWLLYALGMTDSASASYHAAIQLGAYLYCFIVGFLWTAGPRMAGAAPASTAELSALLVLLAAQIGLLSTGRALAAQSCYAALLALLAAFAARRFASRRGSATHPVEFVWVPIGVAFGLLGSALLAASTFGLVPAWLALSGRAMAQQGFTLSVVVGVGGFMAPRLMGTYALASEAPAPGQVGRLRRTRLAQCLVAAGLLGASFLVEGGGFTRAAYALRAMVVTVELGRPTAWGRPPAATDAYVRLLWVSLWFVVAGLWAVACWPAHRVALLHLVLIGGFSLMVFAVATMVVMSHAGQGAALRKPLWVLRVVAVGVPAATAARVLADFQPGRYFALLAVAAVCWLAAGISWLVFITPRVLRVAPEGAFERMHEEAKQRMLRDHVGHSC